MPGFTSSTTRSPPKSRHNFVADRQARLAGQCSSCLRNLTPTRLALPRRDVDRVGGRASLVGVQTVICTSNRMVAGSASNHAHACSIKSADPPTSIRVNDASAEASDRRTVPLQRILAMGIEQRRDGARIGQPSRSSRSTECGDRAKHLRSLGAAPRPFLPAQPPGRTRQRWGSWCSGGQASPADRDNRTTCRSASQHRE